MSSVARVRIERFCARSGTEELLSSSLSLRRSRDLLPAEPHPAELPHCSTCAGGRPGGASRADRIDAGLYRLVCRNGLTVSNADFAHVSIRHVDVSAESFAQAAQAVAQNTPRTLEAVAKRSEVAERAAPAGDARRVRVPSGGAPLGCRSAVMKLLSAEKLLTPVRYGDAQPISGRRSTSSRSTWFVAATVT